MKLTGLLIVSAILFLLTGPANAQSSSQFLNGQAICEADRSNPQGQGCCSWHGGECGCSDGRDVCCDGSLSPSCTCHTGGLQRVDEYVNGYFRSDGTYVDGYWRSSPDW
jgi:hypothetical protein